MPWNDINKECTDEMFNGMGEWNIARGDNGNDGLTRVNLAWTNTLSCREPALSCGGGLYPHI
jgi:hypothetical protein